MASDTQKKKTVTSNKVVFEVEEKDDGLHIRLEGLEALGEIKKNLSSLGCCVPVAVGCAGTTEEAADH